MTDMTRGRAPAAETGGTDRRQFLFGGVLLAGMAGATALAPRRTATRITDGALDAVIPHAIGDYRFATQSGLVLPPQDELSERIYDQILTRVYTADGWPPMMLLIAYGSAQDAGLALHRPEICYPGAGYLLGDIGPAPLAGVPAAGARATYLTATRGDRAEQIYYWTRIGRDFPVSAWDEKMAVLRANLRGVLPDGVLVRISVIDADRAAALPAIERFNRMLIASLQPDGRRLLLGGTQA